MSPQPYMASGPARCARCGRERGETESRRRPVLLPGVSPVTLPPDAMSDTVLGQDVRPEPPTLDDLWRTNDWRTEERADGRYIVDVCDQCGYERSAGRRGRPPDCEVRAVPSRLVSVAKRHDLLPETSGAREDSMLGVPSGAVEGRERSLSAVPCAMCRSSDGRGASGVRLRTVRGGGADAPLWVAAGLPAAGAGQRGDRQRRRRVRVLWCRAGRRALPSATPFDRVRASEHGHRALL